ncbi:hypothetical protein EJ02DRAFT_458179 [Clathrospora elynae]|uniref:Uncharacterized protein n=1 Tax=Clathrospora elynae TaxID=706981 RepID=A0A6A5SL78_9PLEO|nr:hypothetical protein EJ02DRAFT_458179 [Clathrospora elynae]
MVSTFLTAPITVREQIYRELLTCEPSTAINKGKAPSSPICQLLTLNRQISDEVTKFLKGQLCVLIKTNDPCFIQDSLEDENKRLSLISQLQSQDGAVRKDATSAPIAMELDFYMFHSNLEAISSSAFLVPVTSIKALLSMLWLPGWSIWCMQASLTFTLVNTFSYSQEKAEDLLIQPWINWFVPSHFVGISTNAAIPETLTSQLKTKLLGGYAAGDHLRKLNSLRNILNAGPGEFAAKKLAMASKYAQVIWDCHFECMRDASTGHFTSDSVLNLWIITCRTAADHVMVLLNAARDGEEGPEIASASGDAEKLAEARRVAEKTISFLSNKSVRACEQTAGVERVQTAVRKSKALMCFRAHMACKGLGDVHAAVGYLEEAKRFEPESSEKLLKRIEELKAEGPEIVGKGQSRVQKWEG